VEKGIRFGNESINTSLVCKLSNTKQISNTFFLYFCYKFLFANSNLSFKYKNEKATNLICIQNIISKLIFSTCYAIQSSSKVLSYLLFLAGYFKTSCGD